MNKSLNEQIQEKGIQIVVKEVHPYMNRAWKRKRAKQLLQAKKKEKSNGTCS